MSESEHTVKARSDLTHAYNLERIISQSNDPDPSARVVPGQSSVGLPGRRGSCSHRQVFSLCSDGERAGVEVLR